MRLAFTLFKYFPYGGVQRDALQIARCCLALGHEVEFFALRWEGPRPEGIPVNLLRDRGLTNHARYAGYAGQVARILDARSFDLVVGFNKMPGLDLYFAADGCFLDKAFRRPWPHRLTRRFRHFAAFERTVFDPQAGTQILFLVRTEIEKYRRHYGTPESRLHLLPPGVIPDRAAGPNFAELRRDLRAELAIAEDDLLVLLIGSGFRTKGLDRALRAIAALPEAFRERTRFVAIGQDRAAPFERLARRLGVARRFRVFAGRDDIPRFLQGADLLIHPAYYENSGMVLLESIIAGLPVLTTDSCGYAHFVTDVGAGRVLPGPYEQAALNAALRDMLTSAEQRQRWRANGIEFGRTADLYNLHSRAARIIDRVGREKLGAGQ